MQKTGLIISLGLLLMYLFKSKQSAPMDNGDKADVEDILEYGSNDPMSGVEIKPIMIVKAPYPVPGRVYGKVGIEFRNTSDTCYQIAYVKADPYLYDIPFYYRTKNGVHQWNNKYAGLVLMPKSPIEVDIPFRTKEQASFWFDYFGEADGITDTQKVALNRVINTGTCVNYKAAVTDIEIQWYEYDPNTKERIGDKHTWTLIGFPTWIQGE